jgi:hypothetical protein
MDIIQQLQDLKEWSQNRSRYERRMNFRNGQLVQPGPGRPGYSGKSKYDTKELNEATKFYTEGKYKNWDELTKVASTVTQKEMRNAPKEVRDAYHTRIGIRNNLQNNEGKFVVPDPKGGQFKPIYFTEYSDKAFLKDLKSNKGTYEIATDYYLKNKNFIQEKMIGNVEYTRPISYLSKVLSQRRKRNSDIAEELVRFRAWSDEQKGSKTQREYAKKVERLLPLAIENGIVPPNIDTNSKYFKWAKKQKIDPLLKLFNHMEKIGVEHIAGISRAVDIMDYKSLGEIVPLLGGKDVNFEKGLLYDRPMTGLAKNILKSDNAQVQKNNLKALNNMSKEAAEMYNTIAVKYKLNPDKLNEMGGQMLERITKGDPLSNTLTRDADLVMKQYVASGGEKRASFKNLDPEVQKTIKLYESGDAKGGIRLLKAAGYLCAKSKGGQEDVACYLEDFKKQTKDIKSRKPGWQKKLSRARNLGKKTLLLGLGPLDIAIEGLFAQHGVASGHGKDQIWADSLLGLVIPQSLGGPKFSDEIRLDKISKLGGKEYADALKNEQGFIDIIDQYDAVEKLPDNARGYDTSKYKEKLYKDLDKAADDFVNKQKYIKVPANARATDLDAEGNPLRPINLAPGTEVMDWTVNLNPDSNAAQNFRTANEKLQAMEAAKGEASGVPKVKLETQEAENKRKTSSIQEHPRGEDFWTEFFRDARGWDPAWMGPQGTGYSFRQEGMDYFAGGGIAGVRRPNAIPPKSGPMPQGGGLSSQFNRVKKLQG